MSTDHISYNSRPDLSTFDFSMEDFSSECGAREALMVDNKEECKAPAFKFPILRTSSLPWDEYNYSGSKHMVAGENFVVEIQSSIDKLKRLRVVAVAVRAAFRFQLGRHLPRIAAIADDDHLHQIQGIVRRRDLEKLAQFGGISGLAKLLQTSLQTGIDTRDDEEDEEFARRRRAFGENAYPRRQSKTLWHFLYESSKDITLNILMLCAILSLAFGIKSEGLQQGWYDGASISFAVVLVVIVTAISDFRQSRQFQSLDKEKDNIQVQVVRAGRRKGISIFDIVVGDLVELRIGDQVPADGLFLKGQCLAIDESSMTGESEPLLPDQDKHPFLWSGCKVQEGYGFMLVTAVGTSTEWGQTMATISSYNAEETPLQVRLKRVAILIGKVGLSVALLVLTILLIFYFSGHSGSGSSGTRFRAHETSASQVLNSLVDIFSIAVTIVVVAVPEGLPLAVTLSLAYSMRRMMADKALVRRLSACEIMGSATTICSDKTGTLTTNKMTVVKAWIAGKMIESEAAGRDTVINRTLELLFQAIAQNTTGSVFVPVPKGGADDSLEAVEVSGSPTEKALLWWGLKLGMKFEETRCESTVLKVETFSSVKKRAGVALKMPRDGRVFMHWKGAAEIILAACHKWQTERDIAIDMSMEMRREVNNMIEGMASASLRCIAFAYCEIQDEKILLSDGPLPEDGLTLLAVVGMKDPCRPGVTKAVERVKEAGVRVRMVTGDNLATAKAIATECSILSATDMVVDGPTFRQWDDREMREKLPHVTVLARALPSDKLLLVKTLQSMGEVVAVTGDGTNDAPALYQANIGLSMGIEGTEVAKQSSDIIILDDNFASIVRVVQWGRSIYSNIQKFLQFQLTVNMVALAVNFVAAVTSGSVPFTAVQLLWVNLIMDTLGALALATELPANDLMSEAPVCHQEPLLTNTIWRNLAFQATYQVVVLLTLQFHGESLLRLRGNTDSALINRTVIFNTFVLCQIFNLFNARHLHKHNIFHGILHSHLFLGIVAGALIFQVVMVEFLEKFASTMQLDWQHWLVCIGLSSLSWPIAFVVKSIPVPSTPILEKLSWWRNHAINF